MRRRQISLAILAWSGVVPIPRLTTLRTGRKRAFDMAARRLQEQEQALVAAAAVSALVVVVVVVGLELERRPGSNSGCRAIAS